MIPRAVIFDMDGLMLDTEVMARIVWRQAGEDLGYPISDALFLSFVGRTGADSAAILKEVWGADFPLERLRARIASHWENLVARQPIPTKPGLAELIAYLEARGIRRAIATSSRRRDALDKLGPLIHHFEVLVTGDEISHGKPAPDIFLLAAQRLGLSPAECLVLEDSHAGIQAARAAGIRAIMVPDLLAPTPEVAQVCASLHEVREWLEREERRA